MCSSVASNMCDKTTHVSTCEYKDSEIPGVLNDAGSTNLHLVPSFDGLIKSLTPPRKKQNECWPFYAEHRYRCICELLKHRWTWTSWKSWVELPVVILRIRGFQIAHLSHEKNPLSFCFSGWLIGILIMVYYNPYITG